MTAPAWRAIGHLAARLAQAYALGPDLSDEEQAALARAATRSARQSEAAIARLGLRDQIARPGPPSRAVAPTPPEVVARMLALADQGASLGRISREVGLHKTTCQRLLQRARAMAAGNQTASLSRKEVSPCT
jgi:hypothetical protein